MICTQQHDTIRYDTIALARDAIIIIVVVVVTLPAQASQWATRQGFSSST
jgi:hypothetical protein